VDVGPPRPSDDGHAGVLLIGGVAMRPLPALVTAVVAALVVTAPVTAQDPTGLDECRLRLRDAPIETVEPMPDHEWRSLSLEGAGGATWLGHLTPGDAGFTIVSVECALDAASLLERRREVRSALGEPTVLEIDHPGEDLLAYREPGEFGLTHIEWRRGDVIVDIGAEAARRDLDELAAFARRLDAVLPD
jgi:hypothetical protein